MSWSATCHSVTQRRHGQELPLKLQTLSLIGEEKRRAWTKNKKGGGGGGIEGRRAGASKIDKHQLAGNTNPPNPFKIFTSVPPATATQCQRKNQGTRENCGELSDREKATCTIAFWCVLHLFVLSESLRFCLPDQLLGIVAHRYDPIIYLQTLLKHTHTQPLSNKMYNLTDHSVIFIFPFLCLCVSACTMHEFMEIYAHRANLYVGSNL